MCDPVLVERRPHLKEAQHIKLIVDNGLPAHGGVFDHYRHPS